MSQDQDNRQQPFVKMHGLGNDFVIIDARRNPISLDSGKVRALADRRTGVGFDQLIFLEPSVRADLFMRIHNADGSEVEACGNAARCVASLLMDQSGADTATIDSQGGLLTANKVSERLITIDMGAPRMDWQDIPLTREMDTLRLPLSAGNLADPVAVNMGNPHAIFFVDDVMAIDLDTLGPQLEHDAIFPERANISAAQVGADGAIRLRVWERGVGITRACGTAACAARVAAARRDIGPRQGPVELDGGVLEIEWRKDGHVCMTGPVETAYTGTFDPSSLGGPV